MSSHLQGLRGSWNQIQKLRFDSFWVNGLSSISFNQFPPKDSLNLVVIQTLKQHALIMWSLTIFMLLLLQQMVSADAPVLLSKASELFIMELTQISWLHAEEEQMQTVRRSDLGDAIRHKETFHFLDEMKVHRVIFVTSIPWKNKLIYLSQAHEIITNKNYSKAN